MQNPTRRYDVSRIIPPPPEATTRSSVVLPDWMWERLSEIATNHKHHEGKRYTRDDIIRHFMAWAIDEYDKEQREEAQKKGGRK